MSHVVEHTMKDENGKVISTIVLGKFENRSVAGWFWQKYIQEYPHCLGYVHMRYVHDD